MGIRARAEEGEVIFDYKAILVTAACLLGALYSSWLLYRNLQDVGARTGTPMAKLERVESKVRLKPASSFIWGPVKANEDLYRKDSIQTAPSGGATVRFNDGTLLEVGENSLIIIDSLENLSLGFLRGSAVLRTQTGDSRISLDKNGKTKIEALPVRMIEPEALSHYFSEGTLPAALQFAWQVRQGQSGISIQIAQDRAFRGAVHEIMVPDGQSRASANLSPGRYYWRVLSHETALGEASEFIVDGVSALKPVYPEISDRVAVFGGDPNVQFRWVPQSADDADTQDFKVRHRIQIAADSSFRHIVRSQSIAATTGSSVVADAGQALGSGTLYWRIVSQYVSPHSHLTLRSPTEQFSIQDIGNVPIELLSPAPGTALRLDTKKAIRFSWDSDVDKVAFVWQLRKAGASAASVPLKNVDLPTARTYTWTSARAGSYEWRVQALYQGKIVGASDWKNFTATSGPAIALQSPEDGKQIHFWTDPPAFQFRWSADPEARGYRVEVATDANFKDAVSAVSAQNSLSARQIALKAGMQFWRVSALDSSGEVINSSGPRKLDYGVFPPLRAPASEEPAEGATLNPLEMDHDPSITWSRVADAQSYEVTVKQGARVAVDKIVPQVKDAKPVLSLKGLEAGQYSYTIRAIDVLQRKGDATGEKKFEITYGEPLGAPEATSPEVQ